ncbi:MAG: peptidylprolyl isomerase [Pseudomonadota bacterium]|nr:peptidylprolyl isomerase [Pseudomonadota bacterium]
MISVFKLLLLPLAMIAHLYSHADYASARLAMEDASNPLMLVSTSAGPIYVEMLPAEAPENVARFIEYTVGEVPLVETDSTPTASLGYYNGSRFHRVIPNFIIQAGSPEHIAHGRPRDYLADEINASALGLDRLPVILQAGEINPLLNTDSQQEFARRVLEPLYRQLGINSTEQLKTEESTIIDTLQSLTVMRLYEFEGYRYQNSYPTRAVTRGIVALANDGPNRNGPEFFILLRDAPWLDGRYTVIGRVVEGMETADKIGSKSIHPVTPDSDSSRIYSIRKLN